MNIIETLYTITMGGHNVYSKFLTLTFIEQNVKSSRRLACLTHYLYEYIYFLTLRIS